MPEQNDSTATRIGGGPAFPVVHPNPRTGEPYIRSVGMSLRDYFAAKAMHAELVTAGALPEPAMALALGAEKAGHTIEQHIAFNAYRLADAMVAERKAEGRAR